MRVIVVLILVCAGDGRAGPGHHSHQVSRPETLKYSGDTNGELPASDTTDVDPGSEILFRNNWKHQVKMGNGVFFWKVRIDLRIYFREAGLQALD